jgi:uncharacterized protein (DUF1800 family)
MAAPWTYANAAHLLRRAAFGGTPAEIQAFYDRYTSVAEAVDDIVNFPISKKKPPSGGRDFYKAEQKQKQWWVKTMLKAKDPQGALREKMVLFWHNHLCSGTDKVRDSAYTMAYMPIQNGLFRRYANGNFRNLVRDFNRDAANLYYLDGHGNYASNDGVHVAANENFGREVLELFTIGISEFAADGTNDPAKPNYTEADVHQLARAMTGWTGDIEKGVGVFNVNDWDGGQYDDGGGTDHPGDPITILCTTNNTFQMGFPGDGVIEGTADDVLDHILSHLDSGGNHQAAMFVSRKLWTWFAYPAPAPGLKAILAGLAATFVAGGYELKPLLTAIFNHDEFYTDRAKTRTVKNPVDFMVGTLRAMGVKSNGKPVGDSDELYDLLTEMGMELFEPPNVAGWPGGKRWITTGTLVARLEFARRLAETDFGTSNLHLGTIVPIGSATQDPGAVVDAIIAQVGLDDVGGGVSSQGGVAFTPGQRAAVLDFITDGSTLATLDLSDEFTDDARQLVRGAISLVLQAAESQVF